MASKEPPLIRSSKAFSVEIPEGSTSAKARRSDVVAGLMDETSSKEPHFEAATQLAPRNHQEDLASHDPSSSFSHDDDSKDQFAFGESDHLKDHLIGVGNEAIKDHVVGVANDHLENHVIGVVNDASEDHMVDVAQEDIHDVHAAIPNAGIEDHHLAIASVATEAKHTIGIAKEAISDHLAAVANEGIEDHIAAIPKENTQDHIAATSNEAVEDHVASIPNEAVNDHLVGSPQDSLTDNHATLPDEAIEDHHEPIVEPEAPIPLFVSADDDFPDDHMEIEYPPEVDPNVQPLDDEAVVDHNVSLPQESQSLADSQLAHVVQHTPASSQPKSAPQHLPIKPKAPVPLTPDMLKKHEEEIAAKKLRMEEFHGRVDAIRQTVSSINAKLDQIAPHEGKASGH